MDVHGDGEPVGGGWEGPGDATDLEPEGGVDSNLRAGGELILLAMVVWWWWFGLVRS